MIQIRDRFTPDEVAEESARERYVDALDISSWDGGAHFDDMEEDEEDDDIRDSF